MKSWNQKGRKNRRKKTDVANLLLVKPRHKQKILFTLGKEFLDPAWKTADIKRIYPQVPKRTIVATVKVVQAVIRSVADNVKMRSFVAVRSLKFRKMADQRVSNKGDEPECDEQPYVVSHSMATRYFGLEVSSSKYLGASHQ